MSETLLQTKLFIPFLRPPNLVPRPRLIAQLNQGLRLGHKLTLISAPAGFGKTTLAGEWLAGLKRGDTQEHRIDNRQSEIANRFAWLSLDEADNDATRFLTYFIAALQTIEPGVGEGSLAMLQSPQPPSTESILTLLINEITTNPDNFILILDDYHIIDVGPPNASTAADAQASVDGALAFLLEHLPPQMHLVIATREDPHLPLARLRARGQLTELRAADLRFTSAEAAAFLNEVMGLNLQPAVIAALERRTEGWIAGLALAAISMRGHEDAAGFIDSFSGSHRFVLDYLVEEVLEQQPESIQAFLLQTAVLDRLSGPLCDAVCFGETVRSGGTPSNSERTAPVRFTETNPGQNNGQEILETLEHANLFIVPLDDERCWYRYHHLFADLLRRRLLQTQPDRLPILHRRASEWYEQEGFINEAIEHALAAQYFDRAAFLIERHYADHYESGDQILTRRWLAKMPQVLVISRPHLTLLRAWNLFNSGQLEAAERDLLAAEKILDPDFDQAPVSAPDKDQLSVAGSEISLGRIATIRSFIASYSGDLPAIIRFARQALDYLPQQELEWRSAALLSLGEAYANLGQMVAAEKARSEALVTGKASGDIYYLTIINSNLAQNLRIQGRLRQVLDICEHQLQIAGEHGISQSAVAGWLLGIWGEALAEINDLDQALEQAKKGAKLTAHGLDVFYELLSNLCLVRVLFSSGDSVGAEELIQSMQNLARKYDMPVYALSRLSAWQARLLLVQGKLEAASQWAGERGLDSHREPTYLREMENMVFVRILMAQGRLDEAAMLLQRLLEAAEAGGRNARVVELLLLQALLFQAARDTARAMTTLEQALALGQMGGFIRTFVDEGPPLAGLLYEALSRGIGQDYVSRLLAAFPDPEPQPVGLSQTRDPELEWLEPLSDRELEVLQLIAEGLKNQEIGTRLYLSPNTVKAHNRNIFSKLGVNSRTQAVAKARALGIIEST